MVCELRFSYPWEQFLNIYQGIIFPSLPVSILYGITMLLLPKHISNLVFNIDWFLLMHTELILTISRSSSVYSCDISYSISLTTLFFLLWHTFQKCPILLHSVHALLYTGHCLGWWIPPTVSRRLLWFGLVHQCSFFIFLYFFK